MTFLCDECYLKKRVTTLSLNHCRRHLKETLKGSKSNTTIPRYLALRLLWYLNFASLFPHLDTGTLVGRIYFVLIYFPLPF